MPAAPFVIEVPQITLDDLHDRLMRTRWPDRISDYWTSGTSPRYLRQLGEYWYAGFDWRAQEHAINRLSQFRADVGGVGIHFIRSVPAGFAIFPKDISQPPRRWAERFFNVQRWTEMPAGGHFAAMEEPDRLVDDIRAFFRPLRTA